MVMVMGTVCWTPPEVAITETVEVTSLGLELPPQPESYVEGFVAGMYRW